MLATIVHVCVSGDQISAGSTAMSTPTASVVVPPPVTSTSPSGRTVSVWYVRANAMGGVCCQRCDGPVISLTYVVATEGATGSSGWYERPALRILPGRYIAALPPSTGSGSTTVHVCVATSRTCEMIGCSDVEAAST